MPDPRIFPVVLVNDAFATVGAASTLVLAANPHRVDCDFTNDSEETIYLARGNAAIVGSGIRLNANGGTYHIGTNNLFYGAIYGICASGDMNLSISEGTEV